MIKSGTQKAAREVVLVDVRLEKVADIENFAALSAEHWSDFHDRLPQFKQDVLGVAEAVVARKEGTAVGYLLFFVFDNPFYDEKMCCVGMYYLSKAHRGAGIGRQMFACLEQAAKDMGCAKIEASFNLKQPLGAFYEQQGYAPTHVCVAKELGNGR